MKRMQQNFSKILTTPVWCTHALVDVFHSHFEKYLWEFLFNKTQIFNKLRNRKIIGILKCSRMRSYIKLLLSQNVNFSSILSQVNRTIWFNCIIQLSKMLDIKYEAAHMFNSKSKISFMFVMHTPVFHMLMCFFYWIFQNCQIFLLHWN